MLRFVRTRCDTLSIASVGPPRQADPMPAADPTPRTVLTVNAGSTGVKLRLVDDAGRATTIGGLADAPAGLAAVGHRVVYGGADFTAPTVIDDGVAAVLAALGGVAPLHNAPAVALIEEARAAFPGIPQVAVFDTAFHASLPDEAAVYPVPEDWRTGWEVRRHGFHGLSVEWAAGRVAQMLAPAGDLCLVTDDAPELLYKFQRQPFLAGG